MKIKAFKFPLKYLLIAFASILGLAIVLGCVFGFNTGVEFGGGYQIKVNVSLSSNYAADKTKAVDYLNSKGIAVESALVEDYVNITNLVIKSPTRNIKNVESVRAGLAEALGCGVDLVSVETVSGSFNGEALIMYGISILIMAVVVFVAGLFRYKVMGGLVLALDTIASFLTFMALMVITRLPLSSSSYVVGAVAVLVSLVIVASILEQVRANIGTKKYENASESVIVTDSANKFSWPIIVLISLVALSSIAMLFVGNTFVFLTALSVLVAIISSVFIGFFTCSGLYIYLLDVYNITLERRVSKNPDKFAKTKKTITK